MHRITQLNPPLRVITPLGDAVAYFLWTEDRAVFFGVFQDATGEQWWFENYYVRIDPSITDTPHQVSAIYVPPAMEAALAKHRVRYQGPANSKEELRSEPFPPRPREGSSRPML